MKVALAVWQDRVSSVLDFSQRLIVVELERGCEKSRVEVILSEHNALARLARLRELGIDVLICGAVSQPLACASTTCGIRLLPYVTGEINDVLDAYRTGQLSLPQFALPGWWPGARNGFSRGCCRRHGRRRTGRQARSRDVRPRNDSGGDEV
jgi:predicted Fe-Mo cluster-binding NifX family protein